MPVPPPGYDVVETLYESERTIVHRARREFDDSPVILKQLKVTHPSRHDLARFRAEYDVARDLRGPHLIEVREMIRHLRRLVLVEEDFGGRELADLIPAGGLPLGEFFALALQIVQGIGELHAQGVIHRDLTSTNIAVNPTSGELKLIDFGLSTRLSRYRSTGSNIGETAGTLPFMSPEQTGRTNRTLDYRTDFYSLGVILYQMATGTLPFDEARDAAEWFHCHLARQPPPATERRPELPKPIADIIARLLAKSPDARYQSSHGVLVDLQHCQKEWLAHRRIESFELGRQDARAMLRVSQALYGRDAQRRQLLASFQQACQGGRRLTLIAGAAGIGKSTLAAELQGAITGQRSWFAQGTFTTGEQAAPYSAVSYALRQLVAQLLAGSPASVAAWRVRIRDELSDDAELLTGLIPELSTLLGSVPSANPLARAQAQIRFQRALRRFVGLFCQPNRPLTLLLEDLERADLASLTLLEGLLTDAELSHLLVIGTYRDDRLDDAHPLHRLLSLVEDGNAAVEQIALGPLGQRDVRRLLADTLALAEDEVETLAELVHQKTSGNPYFTHRFLETLDDQNLLWFDVNRGRWRWDERAIQAAETTENVVDLLIDRLHNLPGETSQFLPWAALLGTSFDLDTLSQVREISGAELYRQLEPAIEQNILQHHADPELEAPDNPDSALIVRRLGFAHERVREAAAEFFDEADLSEAHLRIGRALQAKLHEDAPPDLLFAATGHLNRGSDLLGDPFGKLELIRLNLRAGRRALDSMAFLSALDYLRQADTLMGDDKWSERPELACAIARDLAESELLVGHFDRAGAVCQTALDHVDDPVVRADFYKIWGGARSLHGDFAQAAEILREGLTDLGVDLPEDDLADALDEQFEQTQEALEAFDLDDIRNLPHVDDPQAAAALSLLAAIEPAAGMTNFQLLQLVGIAATRLTVQVGIHPYSPSGLCHYGVTLCSRGRADEGFQLGRLATSIASESYDDSVFSQTAFIHAAMVMPWSRPLRESIPLLARGHRAGVRSGNIIFAGWCLTGHLMYLAMLGEEVESVLELAEEAMKFGRNHGHIAVYEQAAAYVGAARNLLGHTGGLDSFDSPGFSSAQELLDRCRRHNNYAVYCTFQVARAQIAYFSGDARLALELIEDIEAHRDAMVATFDAGRWVFYHALALIELSRGAEADERAARRPRIDVLRAELAGLAEQAPANFLHKLLLVDAELAWLDDDFRAGTDGYDGAIAEADKQKLPHLRALAGERAARFWLAYDKPDFAAGYLQDALEAYEDWGAAAQIARVRSSYGDLLVRPAQPRQVQIRTTQPAIDITSVFKASESIASKLELSELLPTLMHVTIENAGARHGAFFTVEDGDAWLAARGSAEGEAELLHPRQPLEAWTGGPRSVVRYTLRTQEVVVLDEASHDPRFADDPYFEATDSRSILCMPVEEHGALVGLLFVENNLFDHAFTEERTRVLRILAGHIAVSLRKARLYDELKEKEERFRQLAENIQEVFWLMDWPSRQIVYVSPAYRAVWGRQVPDHPIDIDTWVEPVVQPQRRVVARELRELAASGEYDATYQIERPSGSMRWVRERAFPIRDRHGRVHRIAGVSDDITKQYEIKRMKDEFISVVSHELRTPLTPITGIFRMLAEDLDDELSERSRRMVDLGLRNSQRLLRIIDDLLDMQKLSLGKVDFDVETLDLGATVEEAVEINAPLGESNGIRLELTLPDELLCVCADQSRLIQVVTNLLSNAVKFSEPGTPVEVTVERVDDHGRIDIRDYGPGIPEEARKSIFDKFTQVDASLTRKYGGTGLGLTIAKSIVDRLGGTIDFDTELGEGTTFFVELPLVG